MPDPTTVLLAVAAVAVLLWACTGQRATGTAGPVALTVVAAAGMHTTGQQAHATTTLLLLATITLVLTVAHAAIRHTTSSRPRAGQQPDRGRRPTPHP